MDKLIKNRVPDVKITLKDGKWKYESVNDKQEEIDRLEKLYSQMSPQLIELMSQWLDRKSQ